MDARKTPIRKQDALAWARSAEELYVRKGSKTIYVNLRKDELGDGELAALLLGPTGNLRAPAMRIGQTLVVGFDTGIYQKVLKI